MLWSFCSKGGGVFLWQGVLVFFINGRGFFMQGYWNFFSMAVDFWSKGICVF